MKESKENLRVALLALVLVALSSVPDGAAVAQTSYVIDGAKLLFSKVTPWAEAYAKQSQCKPVIKGTKTGNGYRGWIAGEVDIVAASRHVTDSEKEQALAKGFDRRFVQVGMVDLGVVVNAKNPVKELTLDQLRKVFTGEITNWKDVGGLKQRIIVTTRPVPETGTGTLFQKNILKGAPYAKGHMVMPLFSTTAKIVGTKIGAIGYIPGTSPSFEGRQIKAIGVKNDATSQAILPRAGALKKTDFPVTVPFLLVWDGKSAKADCLRGYAEFCAGEVK